MLFLVHKLVIANIGGKWELWYRVLCACYREVRGRLCFGGGGGSVRWKTVNNIREVVGVLDGSWLTDNISRKVRMGLLRCFGKPLGWITGL
jgi:hypothetical protein